MVTVLLSMVVALGHGSILISSRADWVDMLLNAYDCGVAARSKGACRMNKNRSAVSVALTRPMMRLETAILITGQRFQ
ncbi:hypothetical protein L284_20865 [Novosphingobium lindaniclasticum LE124]|uniref:Uncharacterized protein n=1 Tax=Novosphingobium lindaniclasticum LE124 TaxID=1096930 RepID=T0H6X9_9SPHN|nr:hypothetical protein L284_20865 [Novosphingobium lindaniclasticum LE124]